MTASAVDRPNRLDLELVRRGLAPSRTRAAVLLQEGRVEVDGRLSRRAADRVGAGEVLVVRPASSGEPDLVSRAGHKLRAALTAFDLPVAGRRCLDVGASTGGFTDVLLRAGAAHVLAVDVGHGQLDTRLRSDPRVTVFEGVNARDLQPTDLGGPVSLSVADLSFIPLPLVLGALTRCTDLGGDLVLLVKPQFEVGRERLGAGGVVRDPALHSAAVRGVAVAAREQGLEVRGVVRSPIVGQYGNVELLLWASRSGGAGLDPDDAAARVQP